MKHKLSWHFYTVLLVVVNIAITVNAYFIKNTEYAYEMADLQAMRGAIVSAQMEWKDELPEEPVEYWYDAMALSLVPVSGEKPVPCGAGTRKFGGAVRYFTEMSGFQFTNYNEAENYKGKLPHVIVREVDNELEIQVDWIYVN